MAAAIWSIDELSEYVERLLDEELVEEDNYGAESHQKMGFDALYPIMQRTIHNRIFSKEENVS